MQCFNVLKQFLFCTRRFWKLKCSFYLAPGASWVLIFQLILVLFSVIKLSVWLQKEGTNKHITDVQGLLPQPVLQRHTQLTVQSRIYPSVCSATMTKHLSALIERCGHSVRDCSGHSVLVHLYLFFPFLPFCIPRLTSLLAYSHIRINMRAHQFGRCRVQISDVGPTIWSVAFSVAPEYSWYSSLEKHLFLSHSLP
jgi:hypothetical protein